MGSKNVHRDVWLTLLTCLGVKLDEQLSLETHANSVIRKVSNKVYELTKIRYFITKKAA